MENLLTSQQKETIRRGYKKRLLVVSALMASAALWVSIFVLAPAYIAAFFKQKEVVNRNEVNGQALLNQSDILFLPEEINQKAKTVLTYKERSLVSERIKTLLTAKPEKLPISEISLSKGEGRDRNKSKVSIFGVAPDRETLIAFQEDIKKFDFVESVSLPVGSLAKTRDLDFAISILVSAD